MSTLIPFLCGFAGVFAVSFLDRELRIGGVPLLAKWEKVGVWIFWPLCMLSWAFLEIIERAEARK